VTNENDQLMNEAVYTIGHAAEKLGVAVPTLRMYENSGLIIPHRTKTNRRLYSRNDIKRLEVIIDLIRVRHLNIESIKYLSSLTPCWKTIDCPSDVRSNCPAFLESTTPCWLLDAACTHKSKEDCRKCAVYLACPASLDNPKKILKSYLKQ
jgi:MerR family transcriptional regulator, heat shock protein HspR